LYETVNATQRNVRFWGKADIARTRKSVACDPKRHFFVTNCCIAKGSLDHLVGAREQGWRHGEAKRLGGGQVEHKLQFGGPLYR
jgi:hypothetical protein